MPSFDGIMFETYDEELEFVLKQDRQLIWTYQDFDYGTGLSEGYHLVNRIGYFIASVPHPDAEQFYIVHVSADEEFLNAEFPPLDFVRIGVADVMRELYDAQTGVNRFAVLRGMDYGAIHALLHYCYKKDLVIWEHAHVDLLPLERIAVYWIALQKAVTGDVARP